MRDESPVECGLRLHARLERYYIRQDALKRARKASREARHKYNMRKLKHSLTSLVNVLTDALERGGNPNEEAMRGRQEGRRRAKTIIFPNK